MKIDLHIHSFASRYKESKAIVDSSTKQNIEVLLDKLNENEVGLFSITDHNRFDAELYNTIDQLIPGPKYTNVRGVLAGVEFDVMFDDSMKKCHVF